MPSGIALIISIFNEDKCLKSSVFEDTIKKQ